MLSAQRWCQPLTRETQNDFPAIVIRNMCSAEPDTKCPLVALHMTDEVLLKEYCGCDERRRDPSWNLASLHIRHSAVIVPSPLETPFVHTCYRFLPHGWSDKVRHRSRRGVLLLSHMLGIWRQRLASCWVRKSGLIWGTWSRNVQRCCLRSGSKERAWLGRRTK